MPIGLPVSGLRRTLPAALSAAFMLCAAPSLSAQLSTYIPSRDIQSPPAPQPSTVDHLHGVVLNSLNGKPVARVLVTTPDQRFSVLTDAEGRFSFDLLRPLPPQDGSAQSLSNVNSARSRLPLAFMLRRPGYITRQVTASLPTYTPSTAEPELQFRIVPAALLTGHIASETGSLAANFSVQLLHKQVTDGEGLWLPMASAQANAQGDFRFPDLQPGNYKLLVPGRLGPLASRANPPESVRGTLPTYFPGTASLAAAAPISVTAGETATANLAVRTSSFYRIEIPLGANPEDTPGNGVSVLLRPQNSGLNLSLYAKEDLIRGFLPAGSYDVQIATAGPKPSVGSAHLEVAAQSLRLPPLALHPSGTIAVIVHRDFTQETAENDPTLGFAGGARGQQRQAPSVNLSLQAADRIGSPASLAPLAPGADPDRLTLQNVVEGTYHLRAQPIGSGYIASITSAGTDLLREPLVVGSGGASQPIEITLRNDSASLRVSLSSPGPPTLDSPDAQFDSTFFLLTAIPLDEPERSATTSFIPQMFASGNAARLPRSFPNLAPGRYLVLAFSASPAALMGLEYRDPAVLKHLLPQGAVVTLNPNQQADIELPLVPSEDPQ